MPQLITKLTQPSVSLLIRDAQQSVLTVPDINHKASDLAYILAKARDCGFQSAEIAGGQNFQSAIKSGYNPFHVLEQINHVVTAADGTKAIDMQMLFRGANALGFKHYSPQVIEATLNEFARLGINKIRFFDALNDIDNIYIPDSLKDRGLILQGALCFGYYKEAAERYTNPYYANYAKRLKKAGCDSIAIKDMSGQLDAGRIRTLLPALKKALGKMPIELHIHSTNHEKSLEAVQEAIKQGINGIEVVEGPLSGGTAHHSIETINSGDETLVKVDKEAYKSLQEASAKIFSKVQRLDNNISIGDKKILCEAGVPGGAMPFVMQDLETLLPTIINNNREYFDFRAQDKIEITDGNKSLLLEQAIALFIRELKKVCRDAAYPLLVTPTADICTKQAVWNLASGSNINEDTLESRYGTIDPRFSKLVLGHYGEMKSYQNTNNISPEDSVLEFFEQNSETKEVHLSYLKRLEQKDQTEFRTADNEATDLINDKEFGYKALSFASQRQLALMYALRPHASPGTDPIKESVRGYIRRMKEQSFLFTGFEFIIKPLLEQIQTMIAFGTKLPANPLDMKLSELGEVGKRMFEVYKELPIIKRFSTLETDTDSKLGAKKRFGKLHKPSIETFSNTSVKELTVNLAIFDHLNRWLARQNDDVEIKSGENLRAVSKKVFTQTTEIKIEAAVVRELSQRKELQYSNLNAV